MFSVKCLVLIAFMTILVVQASPGKDKPKGPKDPSVTGHPRHDKPTLAPGGKHNLHDDDHTHDPLHERRTRPPGWNPPRFPWGKGEKRDRPTLPPGVTFPPRRRHDDDDHTHDPLHKKETRSPGWGKEGKKDRPTFPPRKFPDDHHGGGFTKERRGEKPTLAPGATFPPRRQPGHGRPGRP